MKRLIPFLAAATGVALLGSGDAVAAPYYAGRINVTVTIVVISAIPMGSQVACDASAIAEDTTSGANHSESQFMVAAQISASPLTYQCVFSIPWEWELGNATALPVTLTGAAGFVPTGSTNVQGLWRSSSHTFQGTYNVTTPGSMAKSIQLRL